MDTRGRARLQELIGDIRMHEPEIGAHACLARVHERGPGDTFGSMLEICSLVNDCRRLSAELEINRREELGRSLCNELADIPANICRSPLESSTGVALW
jgi:hypothetical protein